jgi:uncharacterized protein YcnI
LRVLLALLVLLVLPASALAHVTVIPETSRPGQTGEFTFRTPNEREDAATVKLEVFIPDGVPIEVEPHEGWTITRVAGGVSWAAKEGMSIRPGRTEDFKVRLGPLPDQPRLVFKALQHYADGQVVRWIQEPTQDAERPAAVLDLGGAAQRDAGGGTSIGVKLLFGAIGFAIVAGIRIAVTRRRRRGI